MISMKIMREIHTIIMNLHIDIMRDTLESIKL